MDESAPDKSIKKLVEDIWLKCRKWQIDKDTKEDMYELWDRTDENPQSCEMFFDNSGMDLFIKIMEDFKELLHLMLGTVGNVAECEHLRIRLIEPEFIRRLVSLLNEPSETGGIEVSYAAAGILAYIVSDGEDIWNQRLSTTNRADVLEKIQNTIDGWQINSKDETVYNSFKPILRLLQAEKPVYQAQYWAVWALAHFTRKNPTYYCPMLIKEGGFSVLCNLTSDEHLPGHVRHFTHLVLHQLSLYKRCGHLRGLEKSSSIVIDPFS